MPVGVCAPPDPDASACEGRNLSRCTPCCPLRLTPSSPLRHERAAAVAEKSAERPPLGYLLATHGVGARDPAGHGAVSAGNRGCRQPGAQTPCHLSLRGLRTPWPQNPVPWAGWLWNLWRKGTSFSNCGHRCVSRLRPWRGWGYRGGRGFAVTLPMDVSLQRFCVRPRERQARGRPAAGPERGGSGLSTTTCCLVNKHEHHSATR